MQFSKAVQVTKNAHQACMLHKTHSSVWPRCWQRLPMGIYTGNTNFTVPEMLAFIDSAQRPYDKFLNREPMLATNAQPMSTWQWHIPKLRYTHILSISTPYLGLLIPTQSLPIEFRQFNRGKFSIAVGDIVLYQQRTF